MASGIVQFREDEETLEFLRKRGINPNEFGREAFERAVRRLRVQRWVEAAEQIKARPTRPIEDLLREDRDAH